MREEASGSSGNGRNEEKEFTDLIEWRKGVNSYKSLCRFLINVMPGFISVVGCRIIPQELGPLGTEEGPILWSPVFEILGDVDGSSIRTGVNWSIAKKPAAGAGAGEYFAPYPDQVLENVPENVLDFLTSRRDRNAVALVCKSWYRAEAYTRSDVFIGNYYAVAPRRVTGQFSRVRSVTPTRLGCALLAVGLHHSHRLWFAGEDPP
ncbi:hypothetical protein L2E82_14652 [Cichorium intybus]|uniref:Uncharacterized protein n=1 Tax=Cichorium intybus TaxID=13427 RepID=A0ACB9F0Z8_CICIN|nr:hypothetical protein L2E82_14652 [Cichorium intybus]